jgi:hypothetical protein
VQTDPYTAPGRPSPLRFALLGERLTALAGLVLLLSTLMGWYVGSGDGLTIAVIGWHTGVLGQLVFFIGLAVLLLVGLREAGQRGGAGEAGLRMPGREGIGHELVHERVVGRAVPPDDELDGGRDHVPGDVGDHGQRQDGRAAPHERADRGEHDPDDPPAPDVGERDEERVERLAPVTNDPPLEAMVEADHTGRICFARSTSVCGSNGLPTKPDAPRL